MINPSLKFVWGTQNYFTINTCTYHVHNGATKIFKGRGAGVRGWWGVGEQAIKGQAEMFRRKKLVHIVPMYRTRRGRCEYGATALTARGRENLPPWWHHWLNMHSQDISVFTKFQDWHILQNSTIFRNFNIESKLLFCRNPAFVLTKVQRCKCLAAETLWWLLDTKPM